MPFLPGFDERWRDAPDFIDCTLREIWTDRRLDRIAKVYAGDAVVHAGPGLLLLCRGVLAPVNESIVGIAEKTDPGSQAPRGPPWQRRMWQWHWARPLVALR